MIFIPQPFVLTAATCWNSQSGRVNGLTMPDSRIRRSSPAAISMSTPYQTSLRRERQLMHLALVQLSPPPKMRLHLAVCTNS